MCIHCTVHVSKCCSELRFVCEFLKTYELHQSEIAFKMSCPDLIPPSAFACYVTVIMLLAVLTFWVQEQLYSCGALRLRCELSAYFVRCQLILWGVSLFCEVSAYIVRCQLILWGVSLFCHRMCEESLHIRCSQLLNDGFCYNLRAQYHFYYLRTRYRFYEYLRTRYRFYYNLRTRYRFCYYLRIRYRFFMFCWLCISVYLSE